MADRTRHARRTSERKGWRRDRQAGQAESVQRRWQQSQVTSAERRPWARQSRWQLRAVALLALTLLGLGFLLAKLLFAPPRTPLVALVASDYDFPIPPNAWSGEDLAGFQALRGSVQLEDASAAWQTGSVEDGLTDFRQRLAEHASRSFASRSLIVYVSMHGVAALDEEGVETAYLVPPEGSPLDQSSWLRVSELLAALESLPDSMRKLLVLETHRLQTNWDLALLHNQFAELIPGLVESTPIENLAVLTAAGPNQVGWASGDLRHSVFAYYLQDAMSGAADRAGNNDRRVSVVELHAFLLESVNRWAQRNRAAQQTPQLFWSAGSEDFEVAWVVGGSLEETSRENSRPAVDLDSLWRRRDQLADLTFGAAPAGGIRFHPLAWREYERQLIWLEQLLDAGERYQARAVELAGELQRKFSDESTQVSGIARYWQTFANQALALPARQSGHSLPLADFLGLPDGARREAIREVLAGFARAPAEATLSETLKQLETHQGAAFQEAQLLRLLGRYRSRVPWTQPARLQRALELQIEAERLAAPPDERAQYWIAAGLDGADHARRLANDRLLGKAEADLGEDETWSAVATQFAQAEGRSQLAIAALAEHDRVCAEIVYLAQWFSRSSRPPAQAAAEQELDQQAAQRLTSLIEALHVTQTALSQSTGEADSFARFERASAELREHADFLRQRFDAACRRLLEVDIPSPRGLREIQSALSIPLTPAPLRRELRSAAARFADATPDPTSSASQVSVDDQQHHLRLAQRWPLHPALALLDAQSFAGAEEREQVAPGGASLLHQAARVREELLKIAPAVKRCAAEQLAAGGNDRRIWATAERLVRRASGFWFPRLTHDPIAELRTLDIQQLLVWHARRALADFWGLSAADGTRFFEHAAHNYLELAQSVLPMNQTQLAALNARLDQLRQFEARGIQTGVLVPPRATPQESSQVTIRHTVRAELLAGRGGPTAAEQTAGYFSLFLRDLSGRIWAETRHLTLAPPGEEIRLVVPAQALAESGPVMQAVAPFRGHEYTETFEIDDFRGQRVDFEPHRDLTTQITVFDTPVKERSILFVLDCSRSMRAPLDVDGSQYSRLEAAKGVLASMLGQLALDRSVRVGVVLFGHRVGWSTDPDQPLEVLRQEGYEEFGTEIPDELMPSEDVESILDLGRFDLRMAGKVTRILKGVEPWGQSPLYLSLVEALDQFARDDPDTDKSIVVITDGANIQFTPATSVVRTPPTGRGEVEQAWQRQQVPMYLVGFGVPEDQREAAEEQFNELAQLSGGESMSVEEAPDLLRTLRGLLGRSRFSVQDVAADEEPLTAATRTVELGAPFRLQPPPRRRTRVQLNVDDRIFDTLELDPGQWLELKLSTDKRGVEPVAFDRDVFAERPLVLADDGGPTGLVLRAHRATSQDRDARFRFSLQHATWLVTPQPAEIWCELAPLSSAGTPAGPNYVFYDSHFQARVPVPVFAWTATDWPAAAEQAEVRVWGKWESTTPTARINLLDRLAGPASSAEEQTFDGLSGVSYQVRVVQDAAGEHALRISVIEKYLDPARSVPSVRVEIAADPAVRPSRVLRRFDPERRLATHSFFYSLGAAERLRNAARAEVVLTSHDALRDGAWTLPANQRLYVHLFDSDGLLQLNDPSLQDASPPQLQPPRTN